jgi:hypothetical protein
MIDFNCVTTRYGSTTAIDGWTEIRSGLDEGEAVAARGQQLLSVGEFSRNELRAAAYRLLQCFCLFFLANNA